MATVASRIDLERLLEDDVPYGDLTTEALGIGGMEGVMQFAARAPMVPALVEDAAAIIELAGCEVELFAASGAALEKGAPILQARGPAAGLLRSWKVAQTLIEIWSGVASETRAIVDAARAVAPDIPIACTRKNVPGTKRYAVAAVKAGGAVMHRLGLSETVLVFPEHRAFFNDQPLFQAVERLRRAAPEKKLVIEVKTADAALAAAVAGFDVIQAEKFSPAEIAALVKRVAMMAYARERPIIAAAGGVNAANAAAYAEAGADILVTSSPYLAKPKDVEVKIAAAGESGRQGPKTSGGTVESPTAAIGSDQPAF
ncbi:ModD protein [Bradyrhizobium sp. BR13661]|jgi:molybdenum transport protein|uniref:ModD protein n=2 Tax=Pseudomonadota TaxID=1224 RepID=UPI002473B008|nr:ModD protein [Bradyrhizobium sp. BR13661]MDH6263322.1 molybdenum transport protein [Bradyrhizobium sp. BR13661]